MAAVSLSPTPSHISSAMSTRRLPLTTNRNAANSPLRAASVALAIAQGSKRVRSHADQQREESYGQPPPAKRQMVENGVQRAAGSPTKTRSSSVRTLVQRTTSRDAVGTHRTSHSTNYKQASKAVDSNLVQWQNQTRARFPKMVFYFESIPDDLRIRLAKHVTQLGAREEKFFSINITHVVTTRPIPAEKPAHDVNESHADEHEANEQPKTINPSLLNRTDVGGRKQALFDASSRRLPGSAQEDVVRRPKTRSTDVLHRAREMDKKIWSLEKLQKILETLDPEAFKHAQRSGAQTGSNSKHAEPTNLLQLLQNERVHGPSDRDPTVATKELHYFKGPYIYVYDIEEKTKPIIVREYPKVADKKHGEWPQFRVASQGRCPFVEDYESKEEREKSRPKERVVKASVQATAPALRPPEVPPPKPVTGKRTLAEMEDGHNRGAGSRRHEIFDVAKVSNPPNIDFQAPQNGFMSRGVPGRFVAGEPVASGLQQSKVTSAIRSQMISSASGVMGVKAGTSKEIHGLQRKVLQKASTPAVSQDLSSRRLTEMSHDSNTFIRSASLGGHSQRKLDMIDETEEAKPVVKLRRTVSVVAAKIKEKARDPKPGYCENCQDKFNDFDEHIMSRKHRKFAESDANWRELDSLLDQLERIPKYQMRNDGEW